MSTPYEVVAAPLTVWLAPTGTAFPATNAAPSGSWFELGTSGALNYDEKGLTVTHNQTLNPWTPVGSAAARKVFRSAESFSIGFMLVDLTPEQYAEILNAATVTTTAGPPATKSFNLEQGMTVATFALLARGQSPVNNTLNAQYQVPIVYQSASPKPVFMKSAPAGLDCEFTALKDPSLGIGALYVQTA